METGSDKIASNSYKPNHKEKNDAELKTHVIRPSSKEKTKTRADASLSVVAKEHQEEDNSTKVSPETKNHAKTSATNIVEASPSPQNQKKKTIVKHLLKAAPNGKNDGKPSVASIVKVSEHQKQNTAKVDKTQIIDTKKKMLMRRQRIERTDAGI